MFSGKLDTLFDSKYINIYDNEYEDGKHYLIASRRKSDSLVCKEDDISNLRPDAVSCFVIMRNEYTNLSVLLLHDEYRYPAGHYLLSPPAGLIDDEYSDIIPRNEIILNTAIREIAEETGITGSDVNMDVNIINPCVFSTPGMTDECNALVSCVVTTDGSVPFGDYLNASRATGTEKFGEFHLITKREAKKMLKRGLDDHGNPYPIYTWSALMYFVSDLWKED